jgi:DnaK suppressor protein
MEKAFIDEMKQKLQQEQKALEQELNSISSADNGNHASGEHVPKFPDYGSDNLGENTNSPQEVQEFLVNADSMGRLETQLESVKGALKRTEDGSYGVCVLCGGEIGEDRLRANPAADKCIGCAQGHR